MNDNRHTTAMPHAEGKLRFREHVLHGIDALPETFDTQFTGANRGQWLIDPGKRS